VPGEKKKKEKARIKTSEFAQPNIVTSKITTAGGPMKTGDATWFLVIFTKFYHGILDEIVTRASILQLHDYLYICILFINTFYFKRCQKCRI
jgi:hypothetical protein